MSRQVAQIRGLIERFVRCWILGSVEIAGFVNNMVLWTENTPDAMKDMARPSPIWEGLRVTDR